jgi:hypothetical protein
MVSSSEPQSLLCLWPNKQLLFLGILQAMLTLPATAGVICAKCRTRCAAGEYLAGVCNGRGNADLTCSPCKDRCSEGQYMSSLCDGTSTRVCGMFACTTAWLRNFYLVSSMNAFFAACCSILEKLSSGTVVPPSLVYTQHVWACLVSVHAGAAARVYFLACVVHAYNVVS